MERADHFPAQDHSWWGGQELRDPRGATCGCAEGNPRPRERYSFASRETKWDGRRAKTWEKPAKQKGGQCAGETAAGFVMRWAGLFLLLVGIDFIQACAKRRSPDGQEV